MSPRNAKSNCTYNCNYNYNYNYNCNYNYNYNPPTTSDRRGLNGFTRISNQLRRTYFSQRLSDSPATIVDCFCKNKKGKLALKWIASLGALPIADWL